MKINRNSVSKRTARLNKVSVPKDPYLRSSLPIRVPVGCCASTSPPAPVNVCGRAASQRGASK